MTQTAPGGPGKKSKTGKPVPFIARKIGYLVVVLIMFVILYLVRNYEKWNLPFLTSDFDRCLFYIELSIWLNIAANILFIFYDNKWFKHLVHSVTDAGGALSIIMIYVIYPFSFGDEPWNKWVRIGLLVLFGFTVLSILVNLIKGFRYLVREPEAV